MKKILIGVLLVVLLAIEGGLIAIAATTNLSQTMSSGTKSVASDASTTLTGLTVSHTWQTATGSFAIDPKNSIGDGAKWDVTMTTNNLTTIGPVRTVAGSNTITTGGRYDGTYGEASPVKRYGVRIADGGAVGTATYQWRVDDGTWSAAAYTAATVILEKGVQVNFSGSYEAGDEWAIGVDVFRYTNLTVTPGTITADSGSTVGMTAGSSGTFVGPDSQATSDPRTLITTEYYRGMGDYAQTISLSQVVHPNSIAGTYTGIATITIL